MKNDFIKTLLESGILNESSANVINEAWESKLNEARIQIAEEMRAEFAEKYEHDKTVMVEALDKMVTESLQSEIEEFTIEKQAINEDRVKAQKKMHESAAKFNKFLVAKLAEEIKELRNDRTMQMESQNKLEKFVIKSLAREIQEFSQDKKSVVEAKVKLVAEGRNQLRAIKQKFISESAARLNTVITNHLKGEIKQLKEDISAARRSEFGRRIFESFASEYSSTYLNQNSEMRTLAKKLQQKDKLIAEAIETAKKAQKLVESKEREVRIIKESNVREKKLTELLGTLNEEKAKVMKDLLESVQTPRLQAAFEKYLPAVLNNSSPEKKQKATLTESISEVTGDKTAVKQQVEVEERDNVIEIKRLAGLN